MISSVAEARRLTSETAKLTQIVALGASHAFAHSPPPALPTKLDFEKMHDVIVVGAGPAGSRVARLLAREGLDVVLADKEEFPRDKVCGGGLSGKTIALLNTDLSAITQRTITSAFLTYRNEATVVKNLDRHEGLTTLRSDFDKLLLDQAIADGAQFLPGSPLLSAEVGDDLITVELGGQKLKCKYLLGADGVFSQVRKLLFPKGTVEYAPSTEALVYVKPEVRDRFEHRALFDFGGMRRGYGWIFPKKDHLNAGVFSVFPSTDIRSQLKDFLARYSSLRDFDRIEYRGSCIPIRNATSDYQRGAVWLIGDAAGFAEAFYGEGIYYALKSAHIAASALTSSFQHPESLEYSRRIRAEIQEDLQYADLTSRLFFRAPKFGYYRMVRNARVNQYFAGLITGAVTPRECFYKTLRSVPYWLAPGMIPYVDEHL